jgi:hypothetical protein
VHGERFYARAFGGGHRCGRKLDAAGLAAPGSRIDWHATGAGRGAERTGRRRAERGQGRCSMETLRDAERCSRRSGLSATVGWAPPPPRRPTFGEGLMILDADLKFV